LLRQSRAAAAALPRRHRPQRLVPPAASGERASSARARVASTEPTPEARRAASVGRWRGDPADFASPPVAGHVNTTTTACSRRTATDTKPTAEVFWRSRLSHQLQLAARAYRAFFSTNYVQ